MRKVVTILVAVLALSFTVSAKEIGTCQLGDELYGIEDWSDEYEVGNDLLHGYLELFAEFPQNFTLVSVENLLGWDRNTRNDLNKRHIGYNNKFNEEGQKFYNGQLAYIYTEEVDSWNKVTHVILAARQRFGKSETTIAYHLAFIYI